MLRNRDVALQWVRGMNCHNRHMFSEDGVIYSYGHHFPMAKLGNPAIVTSERYSNTTSRHVSHVLGALRYFNKEYVFAPENEVLNLDKNKFISFYDGEIQRYLTLKRKAKSQGMKNFYQYQCENFQKMIDTIRGL